MTGHRTIFLALGLAGLAACGGSDETRPSLYGVTSGNGQFVAVGDGTIRRSADARSWTESSAGTNFPALGSVTWTGDQFLAVGATGAIASSPDAVDWLIGSVGDDVALLAVAIGTPGIVAVGEGGASFLSTDGLNWEEHNTGTDETLRGIAWGDGKFVAVGESGGILTSTDGRTWVTRPWPEDVGEESTAPTSLYAVAFGEGVFVAGGAAGTALRSEGGEIWEDESLQVSEAILGVTWGRGIFAAVTSAAGVLTSPTGTGFLAIALPRSLQLNAITEGQDRFVTVGMDGVTFMSLDAVAWIEVAP